MTRSDTSNGKMTRTTTVLNIIVTVTILLFVVSGVLIPLTADAACDCLITADDPECSDCSGPDCDHDDYSGARCGTSGTELTGICVACPENPDIDFACGSCPEPEPEDTGGGGAAATASTLSVVPECARGRDLVQLPCVLETLGNIAQLILGVTGGLALLMFVYGGFMILSSGGNKDRVGKGKNILAAAVVGIFIVLLSGYLIRYGLERLGVGEEYTKAPADAGTPPGTGSPPSDKSSGS
jgi:hypothetical protein